MGRKEKDRDQTGNFRVNTRDIVPGTRATLEVATRKSSDFYGGEEERKSGHPLSNNIFNVDHLSCL